MRDRETIDSELRRIALGRQSLRVQGGQPSIQEVDELLDERLGHRAEPSDSEAVAPREAKAVAADRSPRRRKGVLRRFLPLAALPLSLIAGAAVVVAMSGMHHPEPTAQPAVAPPPPPPSTARPIPVAPKVPPPQVDIVDRAFVAALNHEGVPVPSNEYVTAHGHAVCDFLAQQPNFAEAVSFVQRSSIWDANESASFTAGAVMSYCPQYQPSSPAELQPGLQDALSRLQTIDRDLQGIQGDLHDIRDGLPDMPGHQ
jgi:Protein of unknown function (DUF732)